MDGSVHQCQGIAVSASTAVGINSTTCTVSTLTIHGLITTPLPCGTIGRVVTLLHVATVLVVLYFKEAL